VRRFIGAAGSPQQSKYAGKAHSGGGSRRSAPHINVRPRPELFISACSAAQAQDPCSWRPLRSLSCHTPRIRWRSRRDRAGRHARPRLNEDPTEAIVLARLHVCSATRAKRCLMLNPEGSAMYGAELSCRAVSRKKDGEGLNLTWKCAGRHPRVFEPHARTSWPAMYYQAATLEGQIVKFVTSSPATTGQPGHWGPP